MCHNLREEDLLGRVREELTKNKIKLWLTPYYDETHGVKSDEEQALQLLREQVSSQLNIDAELCLSALRDLQAHALARLQANQVFKQTGVATIKVKVVGEDSQLLNISIPLTSLASQFIMLISQEISIPAERIKVICVGRVLQPEECLQSQGVKNGIQVMVVIISDQHEISETNKRFKKLQNTKKDVHMLAGRSNANNEYYFQIENQSGEVLSLPPQERKALTTAMTFHEKGRAALKREDYSLALVLFLEADKEYSECRSELLSSVDNYALLHLDISWCYLCLRNPAQIPDADRRLRLCEENFHTTYGPNLERLLTIKGSAGNEKVLFMRLHLLQGVVRFHQNLRSEAKALFQRAMSELNTLKVDDNSLSLLLEFGFTSAEARLGLRATNGNVEAAEELIQRKRTERATVRKRNQLKLMEQRLGMCADGQQHVNPQFVQQMEMMGFQRTQSTAALRLSNNSVSNAISIIQDQPHLLPSHSVSRVMSLFSVNQETAENTLQEIPQLEMLLNSGENNNYENIITLLSGLLTSSGADTSNTNRSPVWSSALKKIQELNKKRKTELKALARISEDLDTDLTEDHLDLNLAQEEQFLVEYLSLL